MANLFVDQFVRMELKFTGKSFPEYDYGYVHAQYKDHIMNFPCEQKMVSWTFQTGCIQEKKVNLTRCKYTDEVRLRLGVDFVTPAVDGVEQPQEGRGFKPLVYSGKTLLSMMDFENKVLNEIA